MNHDEKISSQSYLYHRQKITKKMTIENKSIFLFIAYYLMIITVGMTLFITLMYRLSQQDYDTSAQISCQTVMNTCMLIQAAIWIVYIYNKLDHDTGDVLWGLASISCVIASLIGALTTPPGTLHLLYVCIFMASFAVVVLIVLRFQNDNDVVQVLRLGMMVIIACIVCMVILYNQEEFYIMENIAFVGYCLVSLAFFLVNPPTQWNSRPESYMQPYDAEI
jgi:hypothetical protein